MTYLIQPEELFEEQKSVECSECNYCYSPEEIWSFDFEEDTATCLSCVGTEETFEYAHTNNFELWCSSCDTFFQPGEYTRKEQFTGEEFLCLECIDVSNIPIRDCFEHSTLLEEKLWERGEEVEGYLDNYMGDLYEVYLDGEIHKGIPYWFEVPFKPDPSEINAIDSEDDIQLFHKCSSSGGYYCGVSEHIAPANEDPNEYVRIESERIGQELELQAEDGDFVYTSNEYDLGIYVAVPESIKEEEEVNKFREQVKSTMTVH